MKKIALLLAVMVTLSACAEVELASNMAKRVIPHNTPASKGTFKVGTPYKIDGRTYYPKESYDHVETGIASWYGPNFHGKKTANGEIFDKRELTAAHRTLQMPSLVRVTNLENGRSLIVRVNDRGPYKKGRVIDLSERAAELLDFKANGTAKVKIQVLPQESRQIAQAAQQGIDTSGFEIAANNARPLPVDLPQAIEPAAGPSFLPADYRTASVLPVESELLTTPHEIEPEAYYDIIPGHERSGNFYPEPMIAETPVSKSEIFIQAGSFSVYENAKALGNMLSSLGNTNVVPADINGKKFFRVRLGPIDSVDKADRLLEKVIESGHGKAIIVVDSI
jgi:rare lipoprotein A